MSPLKLKRINILIICFIFPILLWGKDKPELLDFFCSGSTGLVVAVLAPEVAGETVRVEVGAMANINESMQLVRLPVRSQEVVGPYAKDVSFNLVYEDPHFKTPLEMELILGVGARIKGASQLSLFSYRGEPQNSFLRVAYEKYRKNSIQIDYDPGDVKIRYFLWQFYNKSRANTFSGFGLPRMQNSLVRAAYVDNHGTAFVKISSADRNYKYAFNSKKADFLAIVDLNSGRGYQLNYKAEKYSDDERMMNSRGEIRWDRPFEPGPSRVRSQRVRTIKVSYDHDIFWLKSDSSALSEFLPNIAKSRKFVRMSGVEESDIAEKIMSGEIIISLLDPQNLLRRPVGLFKPSSANSYLYVDEPVYSGLELNDMRAYLMHNGKWIEYKDPESYRADFPDDKESIVLKFARSILLIPQSEGLINEEVLRKVSPKLFADPIYRNNPTPVLLDVDQNPIYELIPIELTHEVLSTLAVPGYASFTKNSCQALFRPIHTFYK